MKAKTAGFSLVEMLVVISILAILAGIAVPLFLNQRSKARQAVLNSVVRNANSNIASMTVQVPPSNYNTPIVWNPSTKMVSVAGETFPLTVDEGVDVVVSGTVNNWGVVASNSNEQTAIQGKGAPLGVINWTAQSAAGGNGWFGATYGDGKFVAVTTSGGSRVALSNDGRTWSSAGITGVPASSWTNVTYGNGRFVAVASSGTSRVMISTNGGLTWEGVTSADPFVANNEWASIAYGNNTFVASSVNNPGGMMYSLDSGATWQATSITTGRWTSVVYLNGKFIAAGAAGIAHSVDGQQWEISTPTNSWPAPPVFGWQSVAYGNGRYVAVGTNSSGVKKFATSTDGINWTGGPMPANLDSTARMVYGGGRFVAATGSSVAISNDGGETWVAAGSDLRSNTSGWWGPVIYGNDTFVVLGYGMNPITSP